MINVVRGWYARFIRISYAVVVDVRSKEHRERERESEKTNHSKRIQIHGHARSYNMQFKSYTEMKHNAFVILFTLLLLLSAANERLNSNRFRLRHSLAIFNIVENGGDRVCYRGRANGTAKQEGDIGTNENHEQKMLRKSVKIEIIKATKCILYSFRSFAPICIDCSIWCRPIRV